jgi:hypothetical protein
LNAQLKATADKAAADKADKAAADEAAAAKVIAGLASTYTIPLRHSRAGFGHERDIIC